MRNLIIILCFILSLSACTQKAKKIYQNNMLPSSIEIKDMQGNVVYHSNFEVPLKSKSRKNKITSFNKAKGKKIYNLVVDATAIVNSILNDVDKKSSLDKYHMKMIVSWPFQVRKDNEKFYLCQNTIILKEFKINKKNALFEAMSNYLRNEYIPYRIAHLNGENKTD